MKIGLKKKEEARKKRDYLFLNRMLNIVPRNQRMQKKLFQKTAYQPARLNVANKRDEKKIIFFFSFQNLQNGFECGLEPEKILGATDSVGELQYLMKWYVF